MSNTLALIALFVVGSADGQCVVGDNLGDNKLCKTGANEVGKCNGATCNRSTECDAKDASNTDACGENDAGNCLNKKCTYQPIVGTCDLLSASGMLCKSSNVVGTCDATTRTTCTQASGCSGTEACGTGGAGKCDGSGVCKYTAPAVGTCGAFSPANMACMSGGQVGGCDETTRTTCTPATCASGSSADCGPGNVGKCNNQQCKYKVPAVGMCGVFSPANMACMSGGQVGGCDETTRTTCTLATCASGSSADCGPGNVGKCNSQECKYKVPAVGMCGAFSAADRLCKNNSDGIGTCTGSTCTPATGCSADGNEACGTGGAGRCNAGTCKYTAPAVGMCGAFSPATRWCKNSANVIGQCSGATCTPTSCSGTAACGGADEDLGTCGNGECKYPEGTCSALSVTGMLCKAGSNVIGTCSGSKCNATTACTGGGPCGPGNVGTCASTSCKYNLPDVGMCGAFSAADRLCKTAADVIGTCSGSTCTPTACSGTDPCGKGNVGKCAGGTCTYTTPAGMCDVFSATGMLCKSVNDVVGKCNGTLCDPATCTSGSSAKCGDNDAGTCDSETSATCKYTAPAEGTCVAFSAGAYCKKSALIGMCGASSNCITVGHCKGKKKDHPCGDGNTFKGECTTDNGTCKAIPPGQCHASAATGDYCRNDTSIGKCNSASTKLCVTTTPCSGKKRNYSCGDGKSWKGRCLTDGGICRYMPPEQCHASGDYCKIGKLIGKCTDGSLESPTMCMTAGRCTGLGANEACGDSDTLKGQCMGGTCLYIAPGQCDANAAPGSYCRNNPLIGKCTSASLPMCDTSEHDCASPPSNNKCGHQTIGTLKGTCDDGKCVAGKSLTVNYTIKVPVGDPNNIGTEAGKDTVEATFQTQIGLPVQHLGGACDMASESAPANGTLTGCSEFPGTNTCKLNCNAGYHIKKKHTRKCTADGMWVGQVGVCAKRCPVTQGTLANGQFTFDTSFSQAPTQGKLICTDVFPHATCSLKCNDTYHKVNENIEKYYRCSDDATPVWKYTTPVTGDPKLACVETALRRQSTRLVLEPGASVDADFMEKFTESIANTFGPTVLASHVSIVGIKVVDSGRRLNDSGRRLIQVDYTILVAKGEEEGATEVDKVDGTRSPEGDGPVGGLRGIR